MKKAFSLIVVSVIAVFAGLHYLPREPAADSGADHYPRTPRSNLLSKNDQSEPPGAATDLDLALAELQSRVHHLASVQGQLLEDLKSLQVQVKLWTERESSAQPPAQFPPPSALDIETEEMALGEQNEQLQKFFELEDKMYAEEYDSQWSAQMQQSLAEVENRLQSFKIETAQIISHDCRAETCRVEFAHRAADANVIAALLAAPGTSEVVLRHIREGDQDRTIALYKR